MFRLLWLRKKHSPSSVEAPRIPEMYSNAKLSSAAFPESGVHCSPTDVDVRQHPARTPRRARVAGLR